MVSSVVTIGAVMTAITIVLGFFLVKASPKNLFMAYLPGMIVFGAGVLSVVSTTMVGKVDLMGVGLGGWGIAFLFSSSIGFIITAVIDSFSNSVTN